MIGNVELDRCFGRFVGERKRLTAFGPDSGIQPSPRLSPEKLSRSGRPGPGFEPGNWRWSTPEAAEFAMASLVFAAAMSTLS